MPQVCFKFLIFLSFISLPIIEAKEGLFHVNMEGPEHDAAVMARYVINNVNWASIGTVSANAVVKGYPMNNILGISDGPLNNGKGIPYILMSHDISGHDILGNSNISLGVSLAQIRYCQYNNLDQQDPRCARVTFIGNYKNLSSEDPNYAYAKSSLRERHPHLENWKTFYLGKLDIRFIAVLDWFGGAKIVPFDEYLNVTPHEYLSKLYLKNNDYRHKSGQSISKLTQFCPEHFMDQITDVISKFIIHNADWGTVTTLSYKDNSPNVVDGTPFNSVVSVADGFVESGSGIPYIYVSPLEFLVKHAKHDPRVSMLLTLAGTKFCERLDPISDLCPAVILTGSLLQVEPKSTEYNYAQMALFSRHGSMARLPKNHNFNVSMLNVEYVQLRFKFCDHVANFPTSWRTFNTL